MPIALPTLFAALIGPATLLDHPLQSLSGSAYMFSHALLAVAQSGAYEELKRNLEVVLNIVMLFGFLYGTIRIIGGAAQMRRGEYEEGKSAIISGALIAAAPLIMRILFEIFFKSGVSFFGQ